MINLNPFVCGAFLEEEEESECFSPSSTPRSRSKCCKRSKTSHRDAKNPYSARGLDKFSALLADLEAKREKIYAQIGPDSLVRFIYPNSNDCIPIVIKPKDKQMMTLSNKQPQPQPQQHFSQPLADTFGVEAPAVKVVKVKEEKCIEEIKKQRFRVLAQLKKPSYYMPVVVIMILMMLMVVGRSVAILCVSFAWYLVPIISPEVPIIAKKKATITKKKELGRRWSDNRMMVVRKGMSPPPRVSKISASAAVTRSSSPQHLRPLL